VLEPEELAELEATLLPALERHHLRLLAHGLRTLQAIAGRRDGPCPDPAAIAAWCAGQPLIAEDPGFAEAFRSQMASTALQLEAIAAPDAKAPLQLDLADLARWAVRQADERLSSATAAPPPD
jgi:hypothetical protein